MRAADIVGHERGVLVEDFEDVQHHRDAEGSVARRRDAVTFQCEGGEDRIADFDLELM